MTAARRSHAPLAVTALMALLASGCIPLGESPESTNPEGDDPQGVGESAQDETDGPEAEGDDDSDQDDPEDQDDSGDVDDQDDDGSVRGNDDQDEDDDEAAEEGEADDEVADDIGDGDSPVVVEGSLWDYEDEQLVEVEVRVYPLVRDSLDGEDSLAARVDFELLDEGQLDLESVLNSADGSPDEVRLVDTEELTVQTPVVASDGEEVVVPTSLSSEMLFPGDVATWTGFYEDLEGDSTAVLLPYFGLVEDVAIVDAQALEETTLGEYEFADGLGYEPEEVTHRTYPADVYRERDRDDVSIRDDDGQATLTMASDVLFEIDEHELDEDADAALEAAAEELDRLDGGELFIVGHTDDVRDEDYNQALSERRADAVQNRLEELTDLSDFDVTVEGRNFQEPVAENDTEEGRAQNRRVELLFELPELDDLQDLGQIGEPPEPEGPVGATDEALEVTGDDGRAAEVAVEEVYQVENVLVGRLSVEITRNADGYDSSGQLAWPFSFGSDGLREERESLGEGGQVDALSLLIGDSRVFPLEMSGIGWISGVDDDGELIREELPWYSPLADRVFGGGYGADEGTRGIVTVLWPLVSSEEVTIDVPVETAYEQRADLDPWRFEDVPVQEERQDATPDDDDADEDEESAGDDD